MSPDAFHTESDIVMDMKASESRIAATRRLLRVAAKALAGSVAVLAGVVLILSRDQTLGFLGVLLVGGVAIWAGRLVMRSFRQVHGDAEDNTMVCETCGAFPKADLRHRSRQREAALWGLAGVLLMLGGYSAEGRGAAILAPFLGLLGVVALKLAAMAWDGETDHCPQCDGTKVACSTSLAGRALLESSKKEPIERREGSRTGSPMTS